MARETLGLGKHCRTCGVRAATLGSVCPACGRPYVAGGLLERIPLMGSDPLASSAATYAWAVVVLLLGAGLVWLLIVHPAIGIVCVAFAFGCLVAAIGIANVLADRRR